MSTGIALVRLAEIDGSLLDVLSHARAESSRAVILDGTAGFAGELSEADLWRLQRFVLPLVFVAAGDIRGAALDVAVLSDIRVCERGTVFGTATRAQERLALLLRGVEFPIELTAESAWLAGFVSEVSLPGQGLGAAERIASSIAQRGPIATRLGKEAVWRGLPQEFEQALRFETDLTLLLQTTKDRAEGVSAFVQKRAPVFTGE